MAAPFLMSVGEIGVMRAAGVIDLPTAQKYVNFHDYILERAGAAFRLELPHRFFNRRIGRAAGLRVSPDGRVIGEPEWQANAARWLPSPDDMAYVDSLMRGSPPRARLRAGLRPRPGA